MQPSVKIIKDFPPTDQYKYDESLWGRQHDDAFVIINCQATNIYYPEHWTPLSLKCAFNGKEYYKLKNTTYSVTDNNFLVLNQGCEYASYILSDTVTESFTLNFTQRNLATLQDVFGSNSLKLLDIPFQLDRGTTTFIEKLYSYSPNMASYIGQLKNLVADCSDCLQVTELLYDILGEIFLLNGYSAHEANGVNAKRNSTRLELYKRLTIARDYLSSCYGEDITLERLAETCYLNPFYLLREFKKFYHITPHQFLVQVRLREAERLISTSQIPIAVIVQEVGFQDPTSFNRLFKKYYGVSPNSYRKLKNINNPVFKADHRR